MALGLMGSTISCQPFFFSDAKSGRTLEKGRDTSKKNNQKNKHIAAVICSGTRGVYVAPVSWPRYISWRGPCRWWTLLPTHGQRGWRFDHQGVSCCPGNVGHFQGHNTTKYTKCHRQSYELSENHPNSSNKSATWLLGSTLNNQNCFVSEKVHIPKQCIWPTAPRCHPAKAELAQRRVDPHPVTMEPIPEGTVLENGPEKTREWFGFKWFKSHWKSLVSSCQHLEIEISYPRNCQNRPKDTSIRRKVCSNAQTIHNLQLLRCKHPSESQIMSTNLRIHLSKKSTNKEAGIF